jgi:pyrroloquinoline quinone biosynthesis protein B
VRIITAITFIILFCSGLIAAVPYVAVLGVAQDAGVPQMGCQTPFCLRARQDPRLRKMVSSIAVVDPDSGERWIFDATPDLPDQFDLLKRITGDRSNRLDGIFLTHAHIGHYTGLMYLGRESMNAKGIKVFTMPRMQKVLAENAPWSQLVTLENILLEPLSNETAIRLNARLIVTPFLVLHRDEFSETVGFRITSGSKSAIYLPDIDKWQKWPTSIADVVRAADILFLDATFYADGEIPRPMAEVPHPFVSETMDLLKDLPAKDRAKVHFIHFNHSNPLVQGVAEKISEVRRRGFSIAEEGKRYDL